MKIGINGVGIAGPTLAYWLREYGHEPVLFDQADRLRTEGYVVDFWGLGYNVAERMGIIDELRAKATEQDRLSFVDGHGKEVAHLDAGKVREQWNGRFITVPRGAICQAAFDACGDVRAEFGVHIVGIEERADGVEAVLSDGRTRTVRRDRGGGWPAFGGSRAGVRALEPVRALPRRLRGRLPRSGLSPREPGLVRGSLHRQPMGGADPAVRRGDRDPADLPGRAAGPRAAARRGQGCVAPGLRRHGLGGPRDARVSRRWPGVLRPGEPDPDADLVQGPCHAGRGCRSLCRRCSRGRAPVSR